MPPFTMILPIRPKPASQQKARTGNRPDRDTELISTPRQIAAMLQRMIEGRCLLSVRVADWKEEFTSAVLRADEAGSQLILDELTPDSGHAKVIPGCTLRVRTTLNGVRLVFETQVLEIGGQGGIAFYRTSFPETIDYRQRRQHHRVIVTTDRPVSIEIPADDGGVHLADLRNISLGGLYAYLREGVYSELRRGAVIEACTIRLPAERCLTTTVEIAHTNADATAGTVFLGGRFLNLAREDRRELQRLVVELDRELARKQIGNRG